MQPKMVLPADSHTHNKAMGAAGPHSCDFWTSPYNNTSYSFVPKLEEFQTQPCYSITPHLAPTAEASDFLLHCLSSPLTCSTHCDDDIASAAGTIIPSSASTFFLQYYFGLPQGWQWPAPGGRDGGGDGQQEDHRSQSPRVLEDFLGVGGMICSCSSPQPPAPPPLYLSTRSNTPAVASETQSSTVSLFHHCDLGAIITTASSSATSGSDSAFVFDESSAADNSIVKIASTMRTTAGIPPPKFITVTHQRNRQITKALLPTKAPSTAPLHRSSSYRGVTRHRWTGRYEAHLWDNTCMREGQKRKGRQVYLGGYDNEERAARAYDLAALKYWGHNATTNFPMSWYSKEMEEMKPVSKQEFIASIRRRSSGFSRGASIYRGVTRHHQQGRWQARIGRVAGNKDLYLGTFPTEEEAAEAYDVAAIKFRGSNAVTNFELSRYDLEAIANTDLPVGSLAKHLRLRSEAEFQRKLTISRSASAHQLLPQGVVSPGAADSLLNNLLCSGDGSSTPPLICCYVEPPALALGNPYLEWLPTNRSSN